MPEVQAQQQKSITKIFFGCSVCGKKLESIDLGGGGGLFGLEQRKAMYCDNKECERFGILTVAGIKHEE